MHRAMFLLAFYAFLRMMEITISADASKILLVEDIIILDDSKGNSKAMKLFIINWKSQMPGVPSTLTILAHPSGAYLVLAILIYLRIRGTYGGCCLQNKIN